MVALLASAGLPRAEAQVVADLPGEAADMVLDRERELIYVSVPDQDVVLQVSATTYQILDSLSVGEAPVGLELSDDGRTLFVALNSTGAVAVLDLDSGSLQTLDLQEELRDLRTWDVSLAAPNRLFVSASPRSSGLAHIVAVDLVPGFPAQRVANSRFIRCNPTLEKTHDQNALYIGECFSPESLYKLDLLDSAAPLVLEDDHGRVSGTSFLAVGQDLSRIFLASGQILDTGTFDEIGQLPFGGIPRFGSDPTRIYFLRLRLAGLEVNVVDSNTLAFIQEIDLPCPSVAPRQFLVLPDSGGFLVLGSDKLCAVREEPVFPMTQTAIASAYIRFHEPGEDQAHVRWAFDLAPGSDGLDPTNEGVRVSLGTFSQSIQAGSFQCSRGLCSYAGTPPGVTSALIAEGVAIFRIERVDFGGTQNPVSGFLEIGNDFGSATTRLSGSLGRRLLQSRSPGR